MQIVTLSGTVAPASTLPTFTAVFPSLVEPSKIILQDQFLAGAGAMGGRTLEKYDTVKTWTALGATGALWSVNAGGFAATTAAATSRITVAHKNVGKLYAAVEYGGSSFAGLLLRFADASNLWQITMSAASGGLRVEKIVAGVNTVVRTVGMTLTTGRIYHLGITYDASGMSIYVDQVEAAVITDADLSANTSVGLVTGATTNKIWEFVAG